MHSALPNPTILNEGSDDEVVRIHFYLFRLENTVRKLLKGTNCLEKDVKLPMFNSTLNLALIKAPGLAIDGIL